MTLRFGTAGLRGPVREGPDGMNVGTVTRATAGLVHWLAAQGDSGAAVVVGRDARHGSADFFAATTQVLAAAGFDVVALPAPGPTPLVAFATRLLNAAAGVMITASHNPAGDNGYKVYVRGGAQLLSPADREIEAAITAAPPAEQVPRRAVPADPRAAAIAEQYLARLDARFGPPVADGVRIALTAMHGVGGMLAREALARNGFTDVHVVAEQFAPDPDFPTVAFPNPEEPGATDLLLALAQECSADLALALDPDADRCAVGVRGADGTWRMLTGDETGALLGDAVLDEHLPAAVPPVVASSIVSGTLLHTIAAARGARAVRTLTGFKWLVRAGEPLVYAYEEALGHCVDPAAVRDKDGISAAAALARLAAARGSLAAVLDDLQERYGRHATAQRSLRVDHVAQIGALMSRLRTDPPSTLAGIDVTAADLLRDGPGPHTDAVELTGVDAAGIAVRVVARPSGTEPKLKYYAQVSTPPGAEVGAGQLDDLLERVLAELPGEA
ncbi:phospho-sugar mutase [Gordonia alkaliphila]|uniref:phospho-sugar mutase n=1 Tax=Gordonia alkaliphila TaxID=1053547 RepID=UPI001FF213B7|nr:phospho-sugar mutase [Gordonia alkaliphila]MCK0440026.1 phospho-sugar mutase [Gordonia alkaliphila]